MEDRQKTLPTLQRYGNGIGAGIGCRSLEDKTIVEVGMLNRGLKWRMMPGEDAPVSDFWVGSWEKH